MEMQVILGAMIVGVLMVGALLRSGDPRWRHKDDTHADLRERQPGQGIAGKKVEV